MFEVPHFSTSQRLTVQLFKVQVSFLFTLKQPFCFFILESTSSVNHIFQDILQFTQSDDILATKNILSKLISFFQQHLTLLILSNVQAKLYILPTIPYIHITELLNIFCYHVWKRTLLSNTTSKPTL